MTSNIGAPLVMEKSQNITDKNREELYHDIRNAVLALLRQRFRPEFLNRIDDLIVFHSLGEKTLLKIVELQLQKVQKKLADKGLNTIFTDPVKRRIAKIGYQPEFGARPLKRIIQKEIVNELARKLIESVFQQGDKIKIDFRDEKLIFKKIE